MHTVSLRFASSDKGREAVKWQAPSIIGTGKNFELSQVQMSNVKQ